MPSEDKETFLDVNFSVFFIKRWELFKNKSTEEKGILFVNE